MIQFPEVQQTVQEELDRVVGKDNLPSLALQSQLNYTQAVVNEILRHANVAPFSGNYETVQ
jgi:cytochrome P450